MGVLLDGVGDYYDHGGDLTGSADSPVGLVSVWLWIAGGDGSRLFTFANSGSRFKLERGTTGDLQLIGQTVAPVTILDFRSVVTKTAGSGRFHFVASWRLSDGSGHLYVDDAETLNEITNTDGEVDWTRVGWQIGATSGILPWDGAISEFYLANEYLDLSVEANRRKFINADGSPANLGFDGSLPTGTPPIIYCSGGKDAFPVNRGTGGSFTAVGAPLTVPFAAPEDTRARSRHRLGADYYR